MLEWSRLRLLRGKFADEPTATVAVGEKTATTDGQPLNFATVFKLPTIYDQAKFLVGDLLQPECFARFACS